MIHNYFKENFKFLVTDTVDGPDASTKCIRVRLHSGGEARGRNSKKRKGQGDKPFDSRGSSSWPEDVGKFLRYFSILSTVYVSISIVTRLN